MIKKFFALNLLLLLPTFTALAQDSFQAEATAKPTVKLSFLDSLKSTYVADEMTSCVDSLALKELTNQEVFDELYADIKNIDLDQKVDYELPTDLFKERLRLLDEKSPFNIEYNPGLENLVKAFLKNRKHSMERLMGISQYYFPMFEEAMAKYNVPLEIKYLALVESALNPKAVSRVGATGLWQFMYETGKQYKLNINSYVDERSDVLKASDAAARYMMNMYKIFGDWELVLASYNSGAGNVAKAIRRSGGQQNYWNIKKNLPRETQGYVPAFYAYMYIFEYHKEHGIVPEKAIVNHFATDTIAIKKKMSFKQISDLLNISEEQLEFLNPSYKMKVVPYVTNQTHFLRLPKDKVAIFTSNEDKMYAYINYEESRREKPFTPKAKARIIKDTISGNTAEEAIAEGNTVMKKVSKTKFHTVRRGDNLSDIAEKYDVALSDIKKWNKLRGNNVQAGKRLKIMTSERIAVVEKTKKQPATEIAKADKPETAAEKESALTEYTVKSGDNLIKIAKENKLYVADLKKWNNLKDNNVKLGDKIRLTAPEEPVANEAVASTEDKNQTIFYKVKSGDNLSLIADKNNVSIADLKEWNNLSNSKVKVGEKLKIQKTTETPVAEVSKKKSKYQEQKSYIVQKGDSLYSISQMHHTTVADIKKLNDINDENIKPGMELKIKG
ncbi:LysM peptidoglycan-binding domain-containing protein [Flavobacterium humi]|uniref:LysM peptidoglycan-binding domain-containing protein n=1 Tax=Flavobacterium humi TaxID=2562683 RepID=A0A4Z0LBB2_9FLAO|nr:LysM peptidoglycan-binding domain-containing protein [Flavobacterium humi]TGD58625.1 LysM peptidoglycan-binding domain-containing protein [Flavobacterium humi]